MLSTNQLKTAAAEQERRCRAGLGHAGHQQGPVSRPELWERWRGDEKRHRECRRSLLRARPSQVTPSMPGRDLCSPCLKIPRVGFEKHELWVKISRF